MPAKQKIKCPICKGDGEVEGPLAAVAARQRRQSDIAKKLKAEGYTVREIMALMGYKSTNSVSVLINRK